MLTSEGLLTLPSARPVRELMNRLVDELGRRKIEVFARIDHGAGAAAVDLMLRPTELLLFGHPRSGTPLMQAAQTIGIDLPLKMLAWEDAAGGRHLAWNDLIYLARRHRVSEHLPAVEMLAATQRELAEFAAD